VSAPEPLSEQRRAEIEAWFLAPGHSGCDVHDEIDDVCDQCAVGILFAEIDRQAAEVDRLRAITEAAERHRANVKAYEGMRATGTPTELRAAISAIRWTADALIAAALADPVRLPEPEPPCDECAELSGEVACHHAPIPEPEKDGE
jgi:hypothetical protein